MNMRRPALLLATLLSGASALANGNPSMLVVVGAPGEPAYTTNFLRQATLWRATAQTANIAFRALGWGPTEEADDLERLRDHLAAEPTEGPSPLWLILIGHGTFDGREARFNLRGPDLTATQLAEWLTPMNRPVIVLDTTAASAPFLPKLAGPNRIVVTATRSGYEQNYCRFGEHLAETISDPAADFDQDGQTSLLEAFLSASARVAEFYQTEGRLATEHALIDDNGDGLGTPADWFRGVRAVKQPADGAAVDGPRAHQVHLILSPEELALPEAVRARRDALELEIVRLRERKSQFAEADYYRRLETLLLDLARLYESAGSAPEPHSSP